MFVLDKIIEWKFKKELKLKPKILLAPLVLLWIKPPAVDYFTGENFSKFVEVVKLFVKIGLAILELYKLL